MAPNIDSYIVHKLNDMRVNGAMCDLELVTEDGTCVLLHSVVWVAAFEDPSCLREMGKEYIVSSNQLDIFGVSGSVLIKVVDFIYGKKVKHTDELKKALEKFGMKDCSSYLTGSKYHKDSICVREKSAAVENKLADTHDCKSNGDKISITPMVTVKTEKDIENMECDYIQEKHGERKRKSISDIDEAGEEIFSEYEDKDFDIDLSVVKSEPLSPGVSQCSSESLSFTKDISASSTADFEHGTVVKSEPDDIESPAGTSQVQYGTIESEVAESTKDGKKTALSTGPMLLNVMSLPVQKLKRCSRKKNLATSTPRRLQMLLPKQIENPPSEKAHSSKPSSSHSSGPGASNTISCNSKNTPIVPKNENDDQNTPTKNSVDLEKDKISANSGKSGDSKSTLLNGSKDNLPSPEPVKLFVNNSNLNALQIGVPWNIVVNGSRANASNITYSQNLPFSTGKSNSITTTTTAMTPSMCTSVGAPVAIRAMQPDQKVALKNAQPVQNHLNPITVRFGAVPNMQQSFGTNQNPQIIGSAGTFLNPMAIGSPVVGPIPLANPLATGPIIGNFGCQVLQNPVTGSVSLANPVSTASQNKATLQNNSGTVNIMNKQLGSLVFVNSGVTGNPQMAPQFNFVASPQTSSVPSNNVLPSALPFQSALTGFGNLHNAIGSPQTNASVIAGTPVHFKGAAGANVSPQLVYTTHPIPSSSAITSPKVLETQKSLPVTVSELQGCKDKTNSSADDKEGMKNSDESIDSDKSLELDLSKEDDDVNPQIRNIRKTDKVSSVLNKTALQFQDFDPVTKLATYAPVSWSRKSSRTYAGRKKITMIGRQSFRRKEKVLDPSQSSLPKKRGRPPKNQKAFVDLTEPAANDKISTRSSSKRKPESPNTFNDQNQRTSNEQISKTSNDKKVDNTVPPKFRPIAPKSILAVDKTS